VQNRSNSCGFILNQYHAESDQFVWIYTESIPCRIRPIRVDLYSINTMQNRTNSCGFILNLYHAESDQFVWIYTELITCRIGPIRVDLYSINTMKNRTNSCGFILNPYRADQANSCGFNLNQYHTESDQFVWIYTQSIPCRIGPIRVDLYYINTMQN